MSPQNALNIGRARSKAASSPLPSSNKLPAIAPSSARVTGASITTTLAVATIRFIVATVIVLRIAMVEPGFIDLTRPSLPQHTSQTSSSYPTMTMSACVPIERTSGAIVAPSSLLSGSVPCPDRR